MSSNEIDSLSKPTGENKQTNNISIYLYVYIYIYVCVCVFCDFLQMEAGNKEASGSGAFSPVAWRMADETTMTLEGEQNNSIFSSSVVGFQPLNHNQQKLEKCVPTTWPRSSSREVRISVPCFSVVDFSRGTLPQKNKR